MQMNIKILAFSIITTSLFGQSYESSYSGEQLELIEQMFNKECGGTKSYCDCIISAITTNISFKDLRNEESIPEINKLIRSCQEEYKHFPYDPDNSPDLSISSILEFNNRSDSTVYEEDTVKLYYIVENNGTFTAYKPSLILELKGSEMNEIQYPKRIDLADLLPDDSIRGVVEIVASSIGSSNPLTIGIDVIDGNNYRSNKEILETRQISSANENKSVFFRPVRRQSDGRRYSVDFAYTNTGKVPLRYPLITFELEQGVRVTPDDWIKMSEDQSSKFEIDVSLCKVDGATDKLDLYPGEVISGNFQFSLGEGFKKSSVTLTSEFSSYDWIHTQQNEIPVTSTFTDQIVNVSSSSSTPKEYIRTSPVDNIDLLSKPKDNHFAVIIGNENYSSTGVDPVAGASYDAQVFRLYSKNMFGVPEKNIEFIIDGSANQMSKAIDDVISKAKNRESPVVYFYYAGHGWPSETNNEPLLIPADIGPRQIESALKLNTIMTDFRQDGDLELLAFVDACYASEEFSKATRTFVRGIKTPLVAGKQILFSAVSNDQEANTHITGHGVFTYYLLEALRENKNITVGQLSSLLKKNVVDYVIDEGKKKQEPTIHIGDALKEKSDKWPIKK
jgi:hypothetical protein